MKKALIFALLLVTIVLTAPFADGLWLKHKYFAVNGLISTRTPLTLHIAEYQRGWFSSTATIKVTLRAPTLAKAAIAPEKSSTEFIIKEKIYHGPIILRSNKPLNTASKGLTFAVALSELHLEQPDLQINNLTVYHFNGDITAQFDCPNLSSTGFQNDQSVGITGLTGTFKLSNKMKHSEGDIYLAAANIPFSNNQQKVKNARYTYSLDKLSYDAWYGERQLQINDLTLKNTNTVKLHGIMLKATDKMADNNLNTTLKAAVDTFVLNNIQYGAQHFIFNVSNLDLNTLNQLSQKADILDEQGSSFTARSLELTPLALKLLNNGLSINLVASEFNTQWGAIRGNASIELSKQQSNNEIFGLLDNTLGEANFTFPIQLLQNTLESRYQSLTTPQQNQTQNTAKELAKENIDRWILAGWLTPLGNQYEVHLTYKKNQFMLNGKPIKLSSIPLPTIQSPSTQQLR